MEQGNELVEQSSDPDFTHLVWGANEFLSSHPGDSTGVLKKVEALQNNKMVVTFKLDKVGMSSEHWQMLFQVLSTHIIQSLLLVDGYVVDRPSRR